MPTNVFFGGDGVGVDKLRRVLQAYSWHVFDDSTNQTPSDVSIL